ncbi:hypothetical protein GCM10025868_20160 [Angustibacter aerolatus]|uniref:WAP domain-containing protein n=1 Tax=Angustibacter aerolatus TaxID=1162965 RepID=A0ABQ6JIZ7_9ACTN|nr:hypothetical protein GCM10025868_20160 [Angustibacter aerolatus]
MVSRASGVFSPGCQGRADGGSDAVAGKSRCALGEKTCSDSHGCCSRYVCATESKYSRGVELAATLPASHLVTIDPPPPLGSTWNPCAAMLLAKPVTLSVEWVTGPFQPNVAAASSSTTGRLSTGRWALRRLMTRSAKAITRAPRKAPTATYVVE